MTVHEVLIIVGYRLVLTNSGLWTQFCRELTQHVQFLNGHVSEASESESESEEGTELEEYDEDDDFDDDFVDNLTNYMEIMIKNLDITCEGVDYNLVRCHHDGEMDRCVDIGFKIGEFSISGDHEGTHVSLSNMTNAIRKATDVKFTQALSESFMWKYCHNKNEPEVLGQADDCLYCS